MMFMVKITGSVGVYPKIWQPLGMGAWLYRYTAQSQKKGYNQREVLNKATQGTTDINNVIPELNFAFWQMMFTSRHDAQLWLPYLVQIFPNINTNNIL